MLVTTKCRTNCIYCYAERNEGEQALPFSHINGIISEAAELGISLIIFSGGDPFMRKDFIDILEHTINMDIVPATSTKCALSEEQIERLAKIGLKRLQISLDSPEPATADFLTKTHNYLGSMIPVIQNLVKMGIKVETNSVITPYNVYQVPELIEKLVELGVSRFWGHDTLFHFLAEYSDEITFVKFPRPYSWDMLAYFKHHPVVTI